jgi:hypothetical protein
VSIFEDIKIIWRYNPHQSKYDGYLDGIHLFSIDIMIFKPNFELNQIIYKPTFYSLNKSYYRLDKYIRLKDAKEYAKKYYIVNLTKQIQGIYDNIK